MRNCARSVRGGPGGAFTDDLARFPAGPRTSHGSKSPRRGRHLRRSCTTSRWCTASMPSTRRHPSQKATDGAEPDPPSASSTGTTPATSTAGQTAPTPSATNAPRCAPPPASPIHKSCTETRSAASPAKARLGRFASDAHAGRRRGHDHATTAMRRGPGSSRRGTPPWAVSRSGDALSTACDGRSGRRRFCSNLRASSLLTGSNDTYRSVLLSSRRQSEPCAPHTYQSICTQFVEIWLRGQVWHRWKDPVRSSARCVRPRLTRFSTCSVP